MQNNRLVRFIAISAALVFTARGIQMLTADSPYRVLLWDETLLRPFLENYCKISWEQWAAGVINDKFVGVLATLNGLLFFGAAFGSSILTRAESSRKMVTSAARLSVYIGLLLLLLQYMLYARDKSNHTTEFLEYGLQWGSPLLLLSARWLNEATIVRSLKILIGIVFFSHGLYASGFYYTPGNFIVYTMNGLGVDEETAHTFLLVIGIVDMVFALLIFSDLVLRVSIYYFILWGFLTTVARMYCNWHSEMWLVSLRQYFYEMMVRAPHFLMPLALWLHIRMSAVGDRSK